MISELVVLLANHEVGRVHQGTAGQLTFAYDEGWRSRADAYPLSLSLPLAVAEHARDAIRPYLWGLLPDNDQVLATWGRRFGVSARNPFALLAHVGEDCAGAVQFVRPERLDAARRLRRGDIEWITEADIAARLRALAVDPAAGRQAHDHGQFSLAGAKPKTALLYENGAWGVPSGRVPTTHILKPYTAEYDGFAENEHWCLEVAKAFGLPVAQSRVMQFEDQTAIVVTRYDRTHAGKRRRRIHQEDLCQALGVPPMRKYESEGGPGIAATVQLLREHSDDQTADVATFLDAAILSWIIAGTDAHAKNYSILIGAGGAVRLAPLYDIVSALPYPMTLPVRKIKVAMKIGGEYRVHDIGPRQWAKLAAELHIPPDTLRSRILSTLRQIADIAHDVRKAAERDGLKHPILQQLEDCVAARAAACITMFGAA
jgi:serine/threonine-protein kinase HipA